MIDRRFSKTFYAVEADSFADLALWQESHEKYDWKPDYYGLIQEVGKINDRPVWIQCRWHIINGKYILFYYGCSQLVDHKMIKEWLHKHLPADAGTCDAMNFSNCLQRIKDVGRKNRP